MAKNQVEELTLRDFIEVLIRYDVRHLLFPLNALANTEVGPPHELHGFIDDHKKIIYLHKLDSLEEKRIAIIHEFCHCKHFQKGDYDEYTTKELEKNVDRETIKTWKKLYGKKSKKK